MCTRVLRTSTLLASVMPALNQSLMLQGIGRAEIYLEGGKHRDFPLPEVDYPLLVFLRHIYIGNSIKAWNMPDFKESAFDNPVLIPVHYIYTYTYLYASVQQKAQAHSPRFQTGREDPGDRLLRGTIKR